MGSLAPLSSSGRLLWAPLTPRLSTFAQESPLLAVMGGLLIFPFTFFVLPFVLFWDVVLQWLYNNHIGSPLEVLWQDGPELLQLGLRSAALAGKESMRTAQQLGRKFLQDPVGTSGDILSLMLQAIAHPFRAWELAKKFVDPALKASWESFKFALWVKEPSGGTPP